MTYIVRADIPACNGAACRVCEMYLIGFFEHDGGITVVSDPTAIDAAEMASQFCPQQCIELVPCRDDGNPS